MNPWENKPTLDEQSVKKVLSDNIPELAVETVHMLGEGWDNTTWLVNDRYCFRLPKHQQAAALLTNEMLVLTNLPDLSIAVPKPHWVCREPEAYPFPFYGHELVEGTTADQCRLSREQRAYLAEPIARFLKTLHATPTAKIEAIGIKYDQIKRIDVSSRYSQIKERFQYLHAQQVLKETNRYSDYLEKNLALETPKDTVLAHGDLYPRHIILNNDKQFSGVIDWGDSELMHPAVDLAIVYQFLPQEAQQSFWSVYGEVAETTKILAKMRAIFSCVTLCWYAHQVSDDALLQEGTTGLSLISEVLD